MPVTLTVEMGIVREEVEVVLCPVKHTVLSCSIPCCVLCSGRVGCEMVSVAHDVPYCIP